MIRDVGGVRDPIGAAGRWAESVAPERRHLRRDVLAGLPGAIASIPDGMAAAVLVGVNPVHGLYAAMSGPIAGGLSTSTRLMVITTTTAAALAAGSALDAVPRDDLPGALFLLTMLTGVLLTLAGIFRLGRLVRFVSHSVMIGFLTGVAVNILLGQLTHLTGIPAEGDTAVARGWSVLTDLGAVDLACLLTGLTTILILFGLSRTPLSTVSALAAVVVPTLAVVVLEANVPQVSDLGDIPAGLPVPALPDLGLLSFGLVTGAVAVAIIVLVQGAGVAESAPNTDGSPSRVNQDIIAQGVANLLAGLLRGQPVGGSVGSTALNRSFGGRTRWSAISTGLWMLVLLVALSGVVGQVALPILAAVLIYAALGSLRLGHVSTIWRTGRTSQIAFVTTFAATLALPVAAAVGVGVSLSLLLQLNREAMDLRVVELVAREGGGRVVERDPPSDLPSNAVTTLDVYGSLLYAGARTLQARLPGIAGSEGAAVVLRLRGRTSLGATFYQVVGDYSRRLEAADGRLYLSGLSPAVLRQLAETGAVDLAGPVRAFQATEVLGASTAAAAQEAQAWLVRHRDR